MANKTLHGKIIKEWLFKWLLVDGAKHETYRRYYLTDSGWLLVSSGPKGGNTKVLCRPSHVGTKTALLRHGFINEEAR